MCKWGDKKMSKSENQALQEDSKNINKPLLTVKEVSVLLGESVHIIRNWLKDLKDYIPVDKNDAGYNLFGEESVEKIRTVQRLHRDNGYSMKQIEYYFATGGKDFIPLPSSPAAEEIMAKELDELKSQLRQVTEQMKRQEEFNRLLTEKLDEQQSLVSNLLKERDELLLQSMNEIKKYNSNIQLIASKVDEQPKQNPVEERQARITEMITMERIKGQLRKEALKVWGSKPESERMRKIGWFKKEEDHAARDLFVQNYVDDHFTERLKKEYEIDLL
jgi:DNA-binding transcriptional MerR regulator